MVCNQQSFVCQKTYEIGIVMVLCSCQCFFRKDTRQKVPSPELIVDAEFVQPWECWKTMENKQKNYPVTGDDS